MAKYIWILRAALHARKCFGCWKPEDLAFCWETAAVIYSGFEYDNRLDEIGDPVDEVNEELSNWSE